MLPLFKKYPLLKAKLLYVSLGEFPTPVQKLARLGKEIGAKQLYIKRDDLSGKIFGGNKVRKLEFLLGSALHNKRKEVLTFGAAGSNHALATAIYAQHLGLRTISMLTPQHNAYYVRRNLLMSHHYEAELHQYSTILLVTRLTALAVAYQLLRHRLRYGQFPQIIPLGGSSPLGAIGFVNAGFELKEQVAKGEIPEPDYIYVAAASMGTAAGLILGLTAAGLKSQVVPVRVRDKSFTNEHRMSKLINKTNILLSSLDYSFPKFWFRKNNICIEHGFFGKGYAIFTEEGMKAIELMKSTEGIQLEGTYTGKALAALINDSQKKELADKVVLFWKTDDPMAFSDITGKGDYHQLPKCFHSYFTEGVQPLDK